MYKSSLPRSILSPNPSRIRHARNSETAAGEGIWISSIGVPVSRSDIRNYGVMYGLVECRRLFADLLDLPIDNIIIGGNSSFNLIYDAFARLYCFGLLGEESWCHQRNLKFLCPVPGYDCHFRITEAFGFEMINIPMSFDGPDMDYVEKLAAEDPTVKGTTQIGRASCRERV